MASMNLSHFPAAARSVIDQVIERLDPQPKDDACAAEVATVDLQSRATKYATKVETSLRRLKSRPDYAGARPRRRQFVEAVEVFETLIRSFGAGEPHIWQFIHETYDAKAGEFCAVRICQHLKERYQKRVSDKTVAKLLFLLHGLHSETSAVTHDDAGEVYSVTKGSEREHPTAESAQLEGDDDDTCRQLNELE